MGNIQKIIFKRKECGVKKRTKRRIITILVISAVTILIAYGAYKGYLYILEYTTRKITQGVAKGVRKGILGGLL